MIENACRANSGRFFVKMHVLVINISKLNYVDSVQSISLSVQFRGQNKVGAGASEHSRIIRAFLPASLYRCTYRETLSPPQRLTGSF
jgi:hypothetical protein